MMTNSAQLERWLGVEAVERLSSQMREFYWPIPIKGVPGAVYAMPGGDFTGKITAGEFSSAFDRADAALIKMQNAAKARMRNRVNHPRFMGQHGAFANLSAIIAAATGGKKQTLTFQKTGTGGNATSSCEDLWVATGHPAAGAAGASAPSGTAHTSADTGAFGYANPANADTGHFVAGYVSASVANNTLMLYDRLFSVAKTMNSTATEAVTGVPTRYQNQTAGTDDYIGGNFCFPMVPTTALGSGAHNWTVCQYTNQAGTTGKSFPSIAGDSGSNIGSVDLVAGSWFMPLAAGDVGVKALTQMQCSALIATGTVTFVVAHPIAIMPCPVANLVCIVDGINTAFNLTKIFDGACLAIMEIMKPSTTGTNYTGMLEIVAE